MPVVFWSAKTKKLELTTSGTKPGDGTKSLLDQYKAWKKQGKVLKKIPLKLSGIFFI